MKTLTVLFVLLTGTSFAQRDASSNMFWNNYSNINPAMSGMEHKIHGSILHRNQWQSLFGEHNTTIANFNMNLKDKHGVGVNFSNQSFGILKNNFASANYNYQFKLGEESKLSAGIAASFFNTRLDWGIETFGDPLEEFNYNDVNANIGVAYTWKDLLVHASATNIFTSTLHNGAYPAILQGGKSFYLGAAYNFHLGEHFSLKPQVLGQYTDGFTALNVNTQLSFDNKFWIGASFTNTDNFAFMAGWNIYEKFRLGYSYDESVSVLSSNVNGGSHEFSLGFFLK